MHPRSAPAPTAYPVQLDLSGRNVLVVGGGRIAARKAQGLLAAGARVTVVAPDIAPAVAALRVEISPRPYRSTDLDGAWLVVTATDDAAVNARVAADATAARIWVNSADDPANCSFTLPAVARRGPITVAVATAGRSPALAGWLRRSLERELADGYDVLLDVLVRARAAAREQLGTSEIEGWNAALDDGLLALVRSGDVAGAERVLAGHLGVALAAEAAA